VDHGVGSPAAHQASQAAHDPVRQSPCGSSGGACEADDPAAGDADDGG